MYFQGDGKKEGEKEPEDKWAVFILVSTKQTHHHHFKLSDFTNTFDPPLYYWKKIIHDIFISYVNVV